MVRKGRDLEKLVALLEKNLVNDFVKITSPEFIKGKISGVDREIDISLRGQLGSSEILVIFECRDRKADQDITWIEQLAVKRDDVGADKAVAVSSSGFTSTAERAASFYGIELRYLDKINPIEIASWLKCSYLTSCERRIDAEHISINLDNNNDINVEFAPEVISKIYPKFDINAEIFIKKIDGSITSMHDILISLPDIIYSDVPENGSKIKRNIHCNFSNVDDRYQIMTISGPCDIKSLEIDAELSINISKKPIESARIYRKGSEIITESAEFDINISDKIMALEIHKYPQSKIQAISLRKKENV